MTAVNGHRLSPPETPPANPKAAVAEMVFAALAEEGDEAWADLTEEERGGFIDIADHYLSAHAAWLAAQGFRLVPPDAALKPRTEAEALAMLKAAKGWFDAAKRKGGLLTGATNGKKLIMPSGMH